MIAPSAITAKPNATNTKGLKVKPAERVLGFSPSFFRLFRYFRLFRTLSSCFISQENFAIASSVNYPSKMIKIILIFLIAFGGALSLQQQTKPAQRAMAVTIDDLPYVASAGQPFLSNAQRTTRRMLGALEAHRAPAIGFVNEGKLQEAGERDARVALLQQWLDAGMTLGNHTYSHPDANQLTAEQFQDEITKGEVVTRRLMTAAKRELRWFRHPMTHTGDTREKKEAIEAFLAARGYRVAPHTIENSDYIFTVPYSRALRRNDQAGAKRLRDAYLEYTIAVTEFAERVSPQIFGREIPQTLLIHTNDLNADCLDEMLKRFEARGYRFITLDEAAADPAYQTRDTTVSKNGPTWLWRWMKSLGMNVSFAGDPEPPQWVTDLYSKR
jgi:peptidoglycan/xylan/chitin deacetylase (PgdA/CDA1 family)